MTSAFLALPYILTNKHSTLSSHSSSWSRQSRPSLTYKDTAQSIPSTEAIYIQDSTPAMRFIPPCFCQCSNRIFLLHSIFKFFLLVPHALCIGTSAGVPFCLVGGCSSLDCSQTLRCPCIFLILLPIIPYLHRGSSGAITPSHRCSRFVSSKLGPFPFPPSILV